MIGSPTPMRDAARACSGRCRTRDLPYPIAPQEWHFRQSVDYSMSFNRARARLRVAQARELAVQHLRDGEELDRARQQRHWTPSPTRINAVGGDAAGRGGQSPQRDAGGAGRRCASRSCAIRAPTSFRRTSATSRPRRSSSTRCARWTSRCIARRASSQVGGKTYPAGSFVVFTAQAFRPHVIDMFEPQDHPDVIPVSRRRRRRRRTTTPGWTLAFQMGVQFDRVLERFTGPFEKVTDWNVRRPPATIAAARRGLSAIAAHERLLHRAEPAAEGGRVRRRGRRLVACRGRRRAALRRSAIA